MTTKTKTKAPNTKAPKAKAPKAKVAKPEGIQWWEIEPVVPKREPVVATLTLSGGKEAKRFGEVLKQVVDCSAKDDSRPVLNCVQMQTVDGYRSQPAGLQFIAADGFRLAVAEYRPGLKDTKGKASNILARPALFSGASVLAIAKVLKGTTAQAMATLEVKRGSLQRTLVATNDKGESAQAVEQSGSFPNYRKLIATDKAAEPAALNSKYLQWAARFCEVVGDNAIVRISHLHATNPARFDASSDDYRGVAVVMPMYVSI